MPYNERMNPGMNPGHEMNIADILMKIDEILLFHKKLNNKAMKACHANGYNGFKRMHRVNAKCFYKWHIKLENEAYDKFRFVLEDAEIAQMNYMWGNSIIDHIKKWDAQLDTDIDKLVMLNNAYREYAGMGNCVIEKALYKMTKNHEKTGRWVKRFEETKSAHDFHEVDDFLHAKYKAKEEKMARK